MLPAAFNQTVFSEADIDAFAKVDYLHQSLPACLVDHADDKTVPGV